MPHPTSFLNRFLFHPIQAIAALFVFTIFRILPMDMASGLGGWLGRTFGPPFSISKRATRNLKRAFPEITETEISGIVRGMWDNLGRTAAEYPHLRQIDVYAGDGRVEVVGAEYIDLLRNDDKPGIFFSAHMANWEITPLAATQRGLPLDRVYRAANNRLVQWLYDHGRAEVEGALIAKGPRGARQLLASLKEGKHLAMVVDQKMNDGITVPFFGEQVMTAPALAELALRFDCPVVPARIERLDGAKFRLSVLPPLEIVRTGDHQADVLAVMTQVNAQIEVWICETPEQWLWLHNRWPD